MYAVKSNPVSPIIGERNSGIKDAKMPWFHDPNAGVMDLAYSGSHFLC